MPVAPGWAVDLDCWMLAACARRFDVQAGDDQAKEGGPRGADADQA
jgi:hypothetical protein